MARTRTRVFDPELMEERGYKTVAEVARAMGISHAQLSRVQRGEQGPGAAFMRGALRAYPGKTLDELFVVETEPSDAEAVPA